MPAGEAAHPTHLNEMIRPGQLLDGQRQRSSLGESQLQQPHHPQGNTPIQSS